MLKYISTRDKEKAYPSAYVIKTGISAEGGLFVPDEIPELSFEEIRKMTDMSYQQRAALVLGKFLPDFTSAEIENSIAAAYNEAHFDTQSIAPLYKTSDGVYFLELWHGPTCAFKDMALQLLPHLLTLSLKKTEDARTAAILVATSGDTGKAALEGFKDVPGTSILVFYPGEGVSPMQKLQMVTQEGKNVGVSAIHGNFDNAQSAVKTIFTDEKIKRLAEDKGFFFSSANSINWGRLVPQIVYYVSAYCELLKNDEIKLGEKINVTVPTGNFGNILAAYYAKKMGLPIKRLICASNQNCILTDFIRTGVYDVSREFFTTMSPSMDILISSNLERFLFDICGEDDRKIREMMLKLKQDGRFQVDDQMLAAIQANLYGDFCDEEETSQTIRHFYEKYAYVCDPHTAVAAGVYEKYVKATGDAAKTIIASTASPFKFAHSVLRAIEGSVKDQLDDFALLERLAERSMMSVPEQIGTLKEKPVRFDQIVEKEQITQVVLEMLDR